VAAFSMSARSSDVMLMDMRSWDPLMDLSITT
jgi:hypothetical protein